MKTILRRSVKASGFTLVEVSIVIAIAMLAAAYKLREAQVDLTEELGRAQGQQLKVLNEGLYDYGFKNFQAIVDNTAVAGVAITRSPTVAELVAKGNLRSGFSATPYVGGGYGLNINKFPAACVTDCSIAGLVWLQNPVTTNGNVNGPLLGAALKAIGADGGYSKSAGNISGFNGGWSVANPVAGAPAGILAARNGAGTALDMTQYLNRDGTLPMLGDIDMNGNGIIGVKQVVLGAACGNTGEIAKDASGALLSCQGGVYQTQGSAYWKDPVASFAALPVCNIASTGQTRAVYNPSAGSGIRAYTCNGAGGWNAIALDDNGLLTAVKVSANTVQINTVATEGAACANNGEIARNAAGLALTCESATWRKNNNCKDWSFQNLDSITDVSGGTSCYNGGSMINAPDANWYFVINYAHVYGNHWQNQVAYGMTNPGNNYTRTKTGAGAWSAWVKSGGIAPGAHVAISFGVNYCPNINALVYGHKQSAGAVYQGVQIIVDGQVRAIKNGQSEGHQGYESTSTIVRAGECFGVYDIGGGVNRAAWYRPL